MAKYSGTYSCGHEGEVDIIGPKKDRAWKIEHEFSKACPECRAKANEQRREKENKEAAEKTKEMELPGLSGTEKQVAWANTIRVRFIEGSEGILDSIKRRPDSCTYELTYNGAGPVKATKGDIIDALDHCLRSKTEARFWIGRRTVPVKDILAEMMEELKENEVPEDIKAEIDEEERSLTVKPETERKPGVVKLFEKEGRLQAEYRKDNEFMTIVKGKGYSWDGKAWGRDIDEYTGSMDERAAELGNKLLSEGFTVKFMNTVQRDSAIRGDVTKECRRWIKTVCGTDELAVCWAGRDDTLYGYARKLPSAKWSNADKAFHVQVEYYRQIEDFAEISGFKFSKAAMAAVEAYRAKEQDFIKASVSEPVTSGISVESRLREQLESEGTIIEDLKDET